MATTFDVTLPLSSQLPTFPGDPPVTIEPAQQIARGDACNLVRLTMGSHAGTHVDAPFHFEPEGATVERLSLDVLIGRARVVDVGAVDAIDRADLESRSVVEPRVLLKTRMSGRLQEGPFPRDFVHLTPAAAELLVARGVRLVGIDSPSVDQFGRRDFAVHHILLRAGVVIVEGLDLSPVAAGEYEMTCLPLPLVGGDGAPARVVLRTL
jgi:arylformamidase